MAPDRPLFPTYLLPSIPFPFKRRKSSTTSTTSATSVPSLSSSPRSSFSTPSSSPPSNYLPSSPVSNLHAALQNIPESTEENQTRLRQTAPNTLKCITCATDLAFASQIVSKGFTGRHGRAFLVSPPSSPPKTTSLINTKTGRSVNRDLLTGAHVVADVSCTICGTVLGWKYVDAKEQGQKYKIGKFILEMKRVVVGVRWEDVAWGEEGEMDGDGEKEEGVVVFDSEDEDECEDLFAGVWNADVAGKRRGRRVGRKG